MAVAGRWHCWQTLTVSAAGWGMGGGKAQVDEEGQLGEKQLPLSPAGGPASSGAGGSDAGAYPSGPAGEAFCF